MDEKDKTINELRRAVAKLTEVWVEGDIEPDQAEPYLVIWEAVKSGVYRGPFYAFIDFNPDGTWEHNDIMEHYKKLGCRIQIDYWRELQSPVDVKNILEGF